MNKLFPILTTGIILGHLCLLAEETETPSPLNMGLNPTPSSESRTPELASAPDDSTTADWTFKLKEPKLKKQSATDWIKTGGIAGGVIAAGAVTLIVVQSSGEEDGEASTLPGPPAWPEE